LHLYDELFPLQSNITLESAETVRKNHIPPTFPSSLPKLPPEQLQGKISSPIDQVLNSSTPEEDRVNADKEAQKKAG
jgi:hypothetical protein